MTACNDCRMHSSLSNSLPISPRYHFGTNATRMRCPIDKKSMSVSRPSSDLRLTSKFFQSDIACVWHFYLHDAPPDIEGGKTNMHRFRFIHTHTHTHTQPHRPLLPSYKKCHGRSPPGPLLPSLPTFSSWSCKSKEDTRRGKPRKAPLSRVSGDPTPCKVTPVILHGVVSPECEALRSSYPGLYSQSVKSLRSS